MSQPRVSREQEAATHQSSSSERGTSGDSSSKVSLDGARTLGDDEQPHAGPATSDAQPGAFAPYGQLGRADDQQYQSEPPRFVPFGAFGLSQMDEEEDEDALRRPGTSRGGLSGRPPAFGATEASAPAFGFGFGQADADSDARPGTSRGLDDRPPTAKGFGSGGFGSFGQAAARPASRTGAMLRPPSASGMEPDHPGIKLNPDGRPFEEMFPIEEFDDDDSVDADVFAYVPRESSARFPPLYDQR